MTESEACILATTIPTELPHVTAEAFFGHAFRLGQRQHGARQWVIHARLVHPPHQRSLTFFRMGEWEGIKDAWKELMQDTQEKGA